MELTRKRDIEGILLAVLKAHIIVKSLLIYYLNYFSLVS